MLAVARATLAGRARVTPEWSVRAGAGQVDDRRCTVFVAEVPGQETRFESLLTRLAAPADVVDRLRAVAPFVRRRGISCDGADQLRLYVERTDPVTGERRHEGVRWSGADGSGWASYAFHPFPALADGLGPADLCAPALAGLVRDLLDDAWLQAVSGFWLRRNYLGAADRVYLSYPWHPRLRRVAVPLREALARLDAPADWVGTLDGHPLRHLAVSAAGASAPLVTAYFAGAPSTFWPTSLAALRQTVLEGGTTRRQVLEPVVRAAVAR